MLKKFLSEMDCWMFSRHIKRIFKRKYFFCISLLLFHILFKPALKEILIKNVGMLKGASLGGGWEGGDQSWGYIRSICWDLIRHCSQIGEFVHQALFSRTRSPFMHSCWVFQSCLHLLWLSINFKTFLRFRKKCNFSQTIATFVGWWKQWRTVLGLEKGKKLYLEN